MSDLLRIAYGDFIHFSVLLSQMLFALEFSCRMLNTLGCYNFALMVSKSETIQHDQVRKQLKRFSEKQGHECEICSVRDACYFGVDFNALARIYAYAMKIRQMADYTAKFASLDVFRSQLGEPHFPYFSSLIETVERNFHIAVRCFPETYYKLIGKFLFLEIQRRNLYPPMSWTCAMIRDFLRKREKSGNASM